MFISEFLKNGSSYQIGQWENEVNTTNLSDKSDIFVIFSIFKNLVIYIW